MKKMSIVNSKRNDRPNYLTQKEFLNKKKKIQIELEQNKDMNYSSNYQNEEQI